jgi:hypothetical protein
MQKLVVVHPKDIDQRTTFKSTIHYLQYLILNLWAQFFFKLYIPL